MKFSSSVIFSLGLATAISSAPAVERTSIPFVPCYVLCPRVLPYVPVCGVDNVTYSECAAQKCYHVEVAYNGQCTAEGSQQQQEKPLPATSSVTDDCFCPDLFDPCCGADGKFYPSECEAQCAGTTVAKDLPDNATEADCEVTPAPLPVENHGCICPMIYFPVCGADGKIYGNECEAKCAGTTVTENLPAHGTEADCVLAAKHHQCICTMMIYFPVCGADGKVYGNECEAKCAGTTVTEHLPPHGTDADCVLAAKHHECICPMIYLPVCGADGKVYGNECEAKCAGTKVVKNLPPNGTEADCKKPL